MNFFGKKDEKAADLPVRTLFASSKVSEDVYLDTFATQTEAENHAKASAQRSNALWAVYKIDLIGVASPSESIYVKEPTAAWIDSMTPRP